MTATSPRAWLALALLGFLAWQWFSARAPQSASAATPAVVAAGTATEKAPPPVPAHAATAPGIDADADLPPETRATLRLIASHGPFPYDRDGVVFGNYEHLLPEQPRGYYHEYTVPTPDAHNRGARRIITGGDPPRDFYYTGDHYRSFRRIRGQP